MKHKEASCFYIIILYRYVTKQDTNHQPLTFEMGWASWEAYKKGIHNSVLLLVCKCDFREADLGWDNVIGTQDI